MSDQIEISAIRLDLVSAFQNLRFPVSNHPNRNNEVIRVDGGPFGAHTQDCTFTSGNRAFVQHLESPDQLAAGVDRALDFQRMQQTIAFK